MGDIAFRRVLRDKRPQMILESIDCGDYVRPPLTRGLRDYFMEAYLNRYSRPAATLPGTLEENVAILTAIYSTTFPCRVYTTEEAWLLMDTKTSTGLIKVGGVWLTKTKEELTPQEVVEVTRQADDLLAGIPIEMYCLPTLKDEPLPAEKIKQGKVRGVIAMTWAHLLVGTMLLEDLFQKIYSLSEFLPIKVGFSKWYGGADNLTSKHRAMKYGFSGDVSAAESSCDGDCMEPIKLWSTINGPREYREAYHVWWSSVQFCKLVESGHVYQFGRLPSGFKATTMTMCSCLLILFVQWVKTVLSLSLKEAVELIRREPLALYGDDFWRSTQDGGLNFNSFCSFVRQFGWTITREPDDTFLSWHVEDGIPVSVNPNKILCHLKYYLRRETCGDAVQAIYNELHGSPAQAEVVKAVSELARLGCRVELNPFQPIVMNTPV